jgi:hypothetical protein
LLFWKASAVAIEEARGSQAQQRYQPSIPFRLTVHEDTMRALRMSMRMPSLRVRVRTSWESVCRRLGWFLETELPICLAEALP